MLHVLFKKPNSFDRFLAKHGVGVFRFDDSPEDSGYKFFHYCENCAEFRFSHIYDPLSNSERCSCSECGVVFQVSAIVGESFFARWEIARVARELPGNFLKNYLVLSFNRMRDHLPEDREGKTLAELESGALATFIWSHIHFMYKPGNYFQEK